MVQKGRAQVWRCGFHIGGQLCDKSKDSGEEDRPRVSYHNGGGSKEGQSREKVMLCQWGDEAQQDVQDIFASLDLSLL